MLHILTLSFLLCCTYSLSIVLHILTLSFLLCCTYSLSIVLHILTLSFLLCCTYSLSILLHIVTLSFLLAVHIHSPLCFTYSLFLSSWLHIFTLHCAAHTHSFFPLVLHILSFLLCCTSLLALFFLCCTSLSLSCPFSSYVAPAHSPPFFLLCYSLSPFSCCAACTHFPFLSADAAPTHSSCFSSFTVPILHHFSTVENLLSRAIKPFGSFL